MRHIMSKEDFLSILDRQQQSGLTIKDFCENEAYSVSCFHYWKSKYGHTAIKSPQRYRLWQDTGFVGHKPEGVQVCMPIKKPKGKELTEIQKKENKRISGIRIKVEHAIGGVKKCRIVKERFRCHKFEFEDMVILLACGLHNFRITQRIRYVKL
ncbi:transposase family protein [Bacteroides sp. 51]|uniref:IS66 family insertion sequence element accessory protein TnpA n=1 Tax=Bacteroides sp. 51 TaxID=2302938 RepID=UPI0013D33ECA|nr:transposase family protein [Bacteroides sp. 51]